MAYESRDVDGQRVVAGENFVTLRQFAALLGVTYQTVLRYRRKKFIKCIQVGGEYRIYESELRRFLTEGNAKPGDF